MKQSAVDFAVNKLANLIPSGNQILIRAILIEAKEMEKQQQSYSEEEVKDIMAETWIRCVGNDGNDFKEVRDKILETFKNK